MSIVGRGWCILRRANPALALLLVVALSGCIVSVTPPPAPCPIGGLLLELSELSGNAWYETGTRSPEDAPARGAIQKIGTSFSTTGGGINHAIYRFWDEREAGRDYRRTTNGWLRPQEGWSAWATPPDLAEVKVGADEHRLECSHLPSGVEECWFIVRYATYLVEFKADTPAVPHVELARLVAEIDRRMLSCLANQ